MTHLEQASQQALSHASFRLIKLLSCHGMNMSKPSFSKTKYISPKTSDFSHSKKCFCRHSKILHHFHKTVQSKPKICSAALPAKSMFSATAFRCPGLLSSQCLAPPKCACLFHFQNNYQHSRQTSANFVLTFPHSLNKIYINLERVGHQIYIRRHKNDK